MKIEKTCITGRFNLVDDSKEGEERYIQQMDKEELVELGTSIIDLLREVRL